MSSVTLAGLFLYPVGKQLSVVARRHSTCFRGSNVIESHSVLEVTYGEHIDDSYFACESTEEAVQIDQHDVARFASFSVLMPRYDGAVGELRFDPKTSKNPVEQLTVVFDCRSEFQSLWMVQCQERDYRFSTELLWENIVEDSQPMEISDPGLKKEGIRVLRIKKYGTWVELFSDLSVEEMVQIALSLAPIEESSR